MNEIKDLNKLELTIIQSKHIQGFVSYEDFDTVRVNVNNHYMRLKYINRFCLELGHTIVHEYLHILFLDEDKKRAFLEALKNDDDDELRKLYEAEERFVNPLARKMFLVYRYKYDCVIDMMNKRIKIPED